MAVGAEEARGGREVKKDRNLWKFGAGWYHNRCLIVHANNFVFIVLYLHIM